MHLAWQRWGREGFSLAAKQADSVLLGTARKTSQLKKNQLTRYSGRCEEMENDDLSEGEDREEEEEEDEDDLYSESVTRSQYYATWGISAPQWRGNYRVLDRLVKYCPNKGHGTRTPCKAPPNL